MQEFLKTGLVAGVLLLGTVGTGAAEVLAVAHRTLVATGTNTTFVPIKNDGSTTLAFTTTTPNDIVVFTYNAECNRGGGVGWVTVRILVDGAATNPSVGTDFAFCGAAEVGAVRQAFKLIPAAGVHSVQVQAAVQGGSMTWSLDDASLVVEN